MRETAGPSFLAAKRGAYGNTQGKGSSGPLAAEITREERERDHGENYAALRASSASDGLLARRSDGEEEKKKEAPASRPQR